MSTKTTIFAEATNQAIAVFGAMPELEGVKESFAPDIKAQTLGLVEVSGVSSYCLDFLKTWGSTEHQKEFTLSAPLYEDFSTFASDTSDFDDNISKKSFWQRIYPVPSLKALGLLRQISNETSTKIWLSCEYERDKYRFGEWHWLFCPAYSGLQSYEMIVASAESTLTEAFWQIDLIGPHPWKVKECPLSGKPSDRLMRQINRFQKKALPTLSFNIKEFFSKSRRRA